MTPPSLIRKYLNGPFCSITLFETHDPNFHSSFDVENNYLNHAADQIYAFIHVDKTLLLYKAPEILDSFPYVQYKKHSRP